MNFDNLKNEINEVPADCPVFIYIGVGAAAGVMQAQQHEEHEEQQHEEHQHEEQAQQHQHEALAPANYHQFPPFVQDLYNSIPNIHLFIVVVVFFFTCRT